MPAQADIVVLSPDSTDVQVVVEVKLNVASLRETERQLKNFMLQVRSGLGLLVSPQRLWVYRDRFTSDSEDSVELIGEFDIEGLIEFVPPATGSGESTFEDAVQNWLESLPSGIARERVKDAKLWETINRYILPAVETGIVRAAGPR
jgi:hypothetical protein